MKKPSLSLVNISEQVFFDTFAIACKCMAGT